jgi:hypothetical protein
MTLARTGWRKQSMQEVIEKQAIKRAKKLATPIAKRSKLTSKPRKARRTVKRLKDGSLSKSEQIRILKKKLWPIFSKYIRKREADHTGWLNTVDGVWTTWQECDCGHLRHNTERNSLLGGNELWFYENNFAPQSNQGNRNNADDSAQKYMLAAIKKYGIEEVDKMMKMRNTYKLWTIEELEAKYEYYKRAFEAL